MTEYDIQPFDIASASKEEWSKFHKFRRIMTTEVYPGDPITDDTSVESSLSSSLKELEMKCFAVTLKENPNEMIAILRMQFFKETSPSYVGNEHALRVAGMAVLKEHRRKGIGRNLLKLIYDFAVEKRKRIVIGGTWNAGGRAFNQLVGGTEALEMRLNRLDIDDVDWNMVEEWNRVGSERSPDTSLEFYTKIPDEIIEAYCKKYTEVMNQAPLDDLDVGASVHAPETVRELEETAAKLEETWLTVMLREKNGDISGLSDVYYVPSMSPLLYQWLTGVDQKYRGQGKGKWVKAAMLLKVREKFPDIRTISTGNATSNAPMLSINDRLGFKLYKEIFTVQIETEKLGKYLAEK